MVERGQVLERMTLVQAGDVVLEGLFQQGGAAVPVVLAAPHPLLGGSMDSAVLAEIVWRLARRGHPTLRFNWRGVGASGGALRADVEEAARDLTAAVDQIGARAIVGYSFGAVVAAQVAAAHPQVERAVLVAPPVRDMPVDFRALSSSGVLVSLLVGDDDKLAPAAALEGSGFTVHVIAGANHSFTGGLAELGRRVAAALPGDDSAQD